MRYSKQHGTRRSEREMGSFADSEARAGDVRMLQAPEDYLQAPWSYARRVVSNGDSIAVPDDPEMRDIVGFHAATPQLISDFASGAL